MIPDLGTPPTACFSFLWVLWNRHLRKKENGKRERERERCKKKQKECERELRHGFFNII